MVKKTTALIIFLLLVSPFLVHANNGLVPCGPGIGSPGDPGYDEDLGYIPCELCHLFVIFNRVIALFMKVLIPGAATIFIIYGGLNMYMASANPELFNKGKSIVIAAIAGVFIAYLAWTFLGAVLSALGMADWGFEYWQDGFYRIDC